MLVVIADGENVTESTRSLGGSVSSTRIYLRGMYRMLDRRLSPIASCDVGMRFYSYEEDMHGMDVINSFGNIGMEEILGSPENSGLFLSPPIVRCAPPTTLTSN